MTITQHIQTISTKLATSPTPELDARVLIGHVLGLSSQEVFLHLDTTLNDEQLSALAPLVESRIQGTPIPYILGSKEFYGRTFLVTPEVLIPRPETELLLETVRDIATDYQAPIIADIGTGSGCIAITLAAEIPHAEIIASDVSPSALQIAQKNAKLILGEEKHQITWKTGSLLEPFTQRCDIIVANLPYLDQNKYTDDSIKQEPDLALYSDEQGLWHYRAMFEYLQSHPFLIPDWVCIEINPEQAQPIEEIITRHWPQATITPIYDLAGHLRHLKIQIQ